MVIPARFPVHARYRHGADCTHDQGQAPPLRTGRAIGYAACLILSLAAGRATSEELRIATWNPELTRDGPGLLLRDILKGDDPQVLSATQTITAVQPDILVLTAFDHDHDLHALNAFLDLLRERTRLRFAFALRPNAGLASGYDLDGDGRLGEPEDAHGFGRFAGNGGLAILSRWPAEIEGLQDLSALRWADLPGAIPPLGANSPHPKQRLSSTGHWIVPFDTGGNRPTTIMTYRATPPVFDGPEDRNGRRNHDETALWLAYLDGALGHSPPVGQFVILGDANLDPIDGDGRPAALNALLSDDRVQNLRPASPRGGRISERDGGANLAHAGPADQDTADWSDRPGGPGNLRVDYVLPSSDWMVRGAGIAWPEDEPPGNDGNEGKRIRHGLVWVDLMR